MRNNYEYIDPDYTYTNPKTGVLRNFADITDSNGLLFFESAAVIKRSKELETLPIVIQNAETLLEIHRYLFQDVYHWAGQKKVEISKKRKPFFLTAYLTKVLPILIPSSRVIGRSDIRINPNLPGIWRFCLTA